MAASRLAQAAGIGAAVLTAAAGLATAVSIFGGGGDGTPPLSSTVPTATSTGTHTGIVTAPPTLRSEIDRVLDGLSLANVAFNAPTTLQVNESAVIQLLLSGEQPIGRLQEQLTELGEKEGEQIKVSDRMEARLTGLGFKIEAITPAVQLVSGQGVTEWSWEIEPTKAGTRRLHLTLSALIDLRGTESTYTVRTFARSLNVRVTWGERLSGFISDNWQWLWTALLIPLAGWALGRRRRTGTQSPLARRSTEKGLRGPRTAHERRMECRCTHVDILYDTEAEEYAAEHLVSDGLSLVCPDTGARWRVEQRGPQEVLRQVDPEKHLSGRPQS